MSASNHTPGIGTRILAYDVLRVFSILSVVAIHCFMPLRDVLAARSPALVADDLLHYAVPVFVFISGALVWGRPWRREPGAYRRFLRSRLGVIGAPYVAWAVLYLGVLFAMSPRPPGPGMVIGLLLTGHVWYHLYFIPMLLGFYLLTPVAAPLIRRWPEATLAVIYAARILLWPVAVSLLTGRVPELALSYATHIATHLPHMALGAWFALRFSSLPAWMRRTWPILLACGTGLLLVRILGFSAVVWPVVRSLSYPLGMALTVVALALAAFALEPIARHFSGPLLATSSLSFGVYFVHPLWLLALQGGLAAAGLEGLWLRWWAVPAAWALVSSASYVSAWLLSRWRAGAWLVGVRRPASDG